jgi:hypothetical protein
LAFVLATLFLFGVLGPLARWQNEREAWLACPSQSDDDPPAGNGGEDIDPLKDHPFARPRKIARGRRLIQLFTMLR